MPIHIFNSLNQPGIFTSATEAFGINDTGQIVGQYSDPGGTTGFLLSGRTYTTLDASATGDTFAFGMNATGQIVGSYTNATGTHGCLLSGGIDYTTLEDPVAAFGNTIARGINTTGMIVGDYKDASANFHGFLYFNGLYAPIDDPSATTSTQASGINDASHIVGVY